jgi:hypothetical protein
MVANYALLAELFFLLVRGKSAKASHDKNVKVPSMHRSRRYPDSYSAAVSEPGAYQYRLGTRM